MDTALVLVRLGLVLVLAVAAVTKLLDRRGTAVATAALGVPESLAPAVAAVLPFIELAAAALLIPGDTAWFGALVALGLFAAFTIALARTMQQGRRPACHCFGALSAERISGRTVARNGVLAAAAIFVLLPGDAGAGPGAARWLTGGVLDQGEAIALLGSAVLVLVVALVVLLGVVVDTTRRVERLELTAVQPPAGIPVGRRAPKFTLPDLNGRKWSLAELLAGGKPLMLVFTSPDCASCIATLPRLADWAEDLENHARVVLITVGSVEENAEKVAGYGFEPVLVQKNYETALDYEYAGTPSAVFVNADGTIRTPIAAGAHDIETLVDDFLLSVGATGTTADRIGRPLPAFNMPGAHGGHVTHEALLGGLSYVLFWNPTCSFCGQIEDDMRPKLRALLEAGGRVLVMSAGSHEANAEIPLEVATVTDEGGRYAQRLRVEGTPSALLVDAQGEITDVAVGYDDVPALADRAIMLAELATGFFAEADRPGT